MISTTLEVMLQESTDFTAILETSIITVVSTQVFKVVSIQV
jgi:hypothetical protein